MAKRYEWLVRIVFPRPISRADAIRLGDMVAEPGAWIYIRPRKGPVVIEGMMLRCANDREATEILGELAAPVARRQGWVAVQRVDTSQPFPVLR